MLGGIIGDIIGSVYEDGNVKDKQFPLWNQHCRFTDDTVLTVATADWILNGGNCEDFYYSYASEYPTCGYGTGFMKWLFVRKFRNKYIPYNSFGNGSAMRVGPIGWAFNNLEEILIKSKESAECTHNHMEGIKGAQAIACCVFLARMKEAKQGIKTFVEKTFGYNLNLSSKQLRGQYEWSATCQHTVPLAIISFLEGIHFEDSIRIAVSLGGDSDTIACMTGAISEAFWGIPIELREQAVKFLPQKMIDLINQFELKFGNKVVL